MFNDETFTQEMLSNPTRLSKAVIDAMEASDSASNFTINDPNNGLVMQLFANTAIFSKFSEKVDYVTSFFYPQRARNAAHLYPHLSEFDFVNLMASPATLPFIFAMSKDWIIANAVFFDNNYNKLQIPSTSYITMGGLVYSMYHPIDIFVNRNTGAVTAFYNTEVDNQLNVLESNMLLDVREYQQNGLNYFQIQFNMFQFERKVVNFTVGSEQGFIRSLSYEDQFYAVKVFTLQNGGVWKELSYSLTQMYYDFTKPTALISVLSDASTVKIEIPQIYFDNNQISQTIKIEMYTTRGHVNYSLSAADVTGLKANFDTKSSNYSAPLTQMPTWQIVPTQIEVEGGSDAMDYAEIRDAVVNQRFHSRVAVTTPELIEAAREAGFTSMTRMIDDLTERMYFASNVLADANEMVIPTFTGSILIADRALEGDPETIISYTDGYYTILPTTTFKIADGTLTCTPMTTGEVTTLAGMTKQDLVNELNTGKYVRQPFHITLLTSPKSPSASVYNLLSPTLTSLAFIRENPNSAPQMSVTACSLIHQNNGTGGYRIRMTVGRSSNITTSDAANFDVIMTCKNKLGEDVYYPAEFIGRDSNGGDVWEVILTTNYHITTDDHLTVMMYNADGALRAVEISLTQAFSVLTMFKTTFDPTIPADSALNALIPLPYVSSRIAMAEQEMKLTLGQNLSGQIYSGVNTSWGNDVYDVTDSTIYYTTNVPIWQTNETGVLETRVNATTHAVEISKIYSSGDTPADTQDISIKTTASSAVTGNPAIVAIDDTTGLLTGMQVRGLNIPVGSKIATIGTKRITLTSTLTTAVPEGTEIVITNPSILTRTTAIQNSGTRKVLVIDSTEDLLKGQSIIGFGIADGAKVASIQNATTFTMDTTSTEVVAAGTLLTFINKTAHGVVKSAKGDIVRDNTGAPVIVKAAQNQYRIPAILFDGRLFASEDPTDMEVITTISQKLQNYANQIYTIDAGLLEGADVFYQPARTMGLATFGIGNNNVVRLPLTLGFVVTVYVDVAVYNTQLLLTTMTAAIRKIINEEIQNPTIAISETASMIKTKLGNDVFAVEMEGINGNPDLRLIALEDTNATPSIENKLVLNSDQTITREANITVNFVPRPSTAEAIETTRL